MEADRKGAAPAPEWAALADAFDGLIYLATPDYQLEYLGGRERPAGEGGEQRCHRVLYGLDQPCPWCANERVLRGETVRQEFVHPPEGRWSSAVTSAVRRPDGSTSCLWLVQDVTERKRVLSALTRRSDELETILKAYPDLYFWMDGDGTIRDYYANRVSDLFLPPEKFLGKRIQDVMPPDVARAVTDAIEAFSQTRSPAAIEYSLPFLDGERFYQARLLPLAEDQLLAIVRDITVQRLAELAVRESEARYRGIVKDQTELICRFLPEGRLIFVNEATCRTFGKRPDELLGRSFMSLVADADEESVPRRLRSLGPEQPVVTWDQKVGLPRGGTAWLQWTCRAICDERGRVVEFQTVGTDISERVKAELELKRSMQRMRRMIDEIINAMAITVEMRDLYTAGHQRRVATLACAIATEMGLPEDLIDGIRVAGRLHDIGKIYIPAEILSKPSKLTEPEASLMRTHPRVSYDILSTIEFPWPVAEIALQHHELLDGSGYPAGLKGDEIILEARILAVADVVESMATYRPYRPSLGLEKALEQISRNRGVIYDAEAVDACLRLVKEKGFTLE